MSWFYAADYNVPIDFGLLNIDVEGLDWDILQQLLRSKYRPKVVVVEKPTVDTSKVVDYHKIGETRANLIFVTDPI